MQEILELVSTDPNFKGADMDLVRTKILKQKKLLKRIRAKNRVYRPQPKPFVVEPTILDD